jgi:23S rRNA (pseudouridine1915-N3)-methyltransferase
VQKVIIRAIGSLKSPFQELFEEFRERLTFSLHVDVITVKKKLPKDYAKRQEGEAILRSLPAGSVLVALDEHGENFSSKRFAEWIIAWMEQGSPLVFAIGGADGLDAAVLDRAQKKIAFGCMTWPHQLVRIMLIEQLYRAQQIANNHPYHRTE